MKWLIQRFDNLDFVGRAITASVLFADGEFCYGSLVYNGGVQRFCVSNGNAVYVEMVDNGGASDPEFRLVNYSETAEKTIIAVKLELGDKQTLARQDENGNWILNDPPPDKGLELLKCIQSTADPGDTYANKVVYHTGNKPTAEDIGALPIKKGYYVGNIDEITEGAYLVLANATGDMPFTTTWFDLVAIPSGTGAISQIAMCSSVTGTPTQFKFRHHNGEGWSSWSEAATTNYAVNRGGDTMSGDLAITNSRPTLCLTNSGDTEHIGKVLAGTYNMFIGYEGGATSYNILIGKDTNQYTLSNILRLAKVENGVETLYPILHTGNKNLITPNDIGAASTANAETWVFTLADGSTVSKEVILK